MTKLNKEYANNNAALNKLQKYIEQDFEALAKRKMQKESIAMELP
jgi:hypothetical protein